MNDTTGALGSAIVGTQVEFFGPVIYPVEEPENPVSDLLDRLGHMAELVIEAALYREPQAFVEYFVELDALREIVGSDSGEIDWASQPEIVRRSWRGLMDLCSKHHGALISLAIQPRNPSSPEIGGVK